MVGIGAELVDYVRGDCLSPSSNCYCLMDRQGEALAAQLG